MTCMCRGRLESVGDTQIKGDIRKWTEVYIHTICMQSIVSVHLSPFQFLEKFDLVLVRLVSSAVVRCHNSAWHI